MAVHSVCWRWALHDNAECKQSFVESVSSPVLFSSPCCSSTQHHDRHAHEPTHPRRQKKRRGGPCGMDATRAKHKLAARVLLPNAMPGGQPFGVLWCRQLLPQQIIVINIITLS